MTTLERTPLDVWLRMEWDDEEGDDVADAEANTFHAGDKYCVEWYLNAVGLVSRKWFDTYEQATAWLAAEGFEDYSS